MWRSLTILIEKLQGLITRPVIIINPPVIPASARSSVRDAVPIVVRICLPANCIIPISVIYVNPARSADSVNSASSVVVISPGIRNGTLVLDNQHSILRNNNGIGSSVRREQQYSPYNTGGG